MASRSQGFEHYTEDQNKAFEGSMGWHEEALAGNGPQVYRIFGYAGTGKTSTAKRFAAHLKGQVCYAAFTGKAALQLRLHGCPEAQTLHSYMYHPLEMPDGTVRFMKDEESAFRDAALIVIDEVSMVGEELGRDVLSFGKPVLVLGDPAQLPPISSEGFFTETEPDHLLTQIHRQAEDNPIVRIATQARHGETIDYGDYGACRVVPRGTLANEYVLSADQLLVGKNATREAMNNKVRRLLGKTSRLPTRGDRLVCLRNTQKDGQNLFNGALYRVCEFVSITKLHVTLEVISEDFPHKPRVTIKVRREFFEGGAEELSFEDKRASESFTYGYALTVHKSQGSAWRNCILWDESRSFRADWQKWLYTGITRASEQLTLVR